MPFLLQIASREFWMNGMSTGWHNAASESHFSFRSLPMEGLDAIDSTVGTKKPGWWIKSDISGINMVLDYKKDGWNELDLLYDSSSFIFENSTIKIL